MSSEKNMASSHVTIDHRPSIVRLDQKWQQRPANMHACTVNPTLTEQRRYEEAGQALFFATCHLVYDLFYYLMWMGLMDGWTSCWTHA